MIFNYKLYRRVAHKCSIMESVLGDTQGSVHDPAIWALMITGFGMVGATLRARRRAAPLHSSDGMRYWRGRPWRVARHYISNRGADVEAKALRHNHNQYGVDTGGTARRYGPHVSSLSALRYTVGIEIGISSRKMPILYEPFTPNWIILSVAELHQNNKIFHWC